MRPLRYSISLFAIAFGVAVAPSRGCAQSSNATTSKSPDEKYVLGADSRPQPGVPDGHVTEFTPDDGAALLPALGRMNSFSADDDSR
jgi:hypothetical protein